MKYTLLQLTQSVLSSMSSDEVNSIGDTTESLQVAEIIRQKYLDIISRVPITDHEQLLQLDAGLSDEMPVLMTVPAAVADIKWLKYFNTNPNDSPSTGSHGINVDIQPTVGAVSSAVAPGYQYVNILPAKEFIEMTNSFNPAESNVQSFTFTDSGHGHPGTFTFYYKTDRQPSFCCIINNFYVIFDSYDNTQDTTLQTTKTMAWGRIIPVFLMEDSFVPDLAEEQFQLLLNESKALAFFELKQQPHPLATVETKRGWSSIQKNKSIANKPSYFDQFPNYGRNNLSGYGGAVRTFKLLGYDR